MHSFFFPKKLDKNNKLSPAPLCQPSVSSTSFYFLGALFINCSLQLQGEYLSPGIDDREFWENALGR